MNTTPCALVKQTSQESIVVSPGRVPKPESSRSPGPGRCPGFACTIGFQIRPASPWHFAMRQNKWIVNLIFWIFRILRGTQKIHEKNAYELSARIEGSLEFRTSTALAKVNYKHRVGTQFRLRVIALGLLPWLGLKKWGFLVLFRRGTFSAVSMVTQGSGRV